ncbi:hypothetical protein ES703_41722 [subsurface metagenome]
MSMTVDDGSCYHARVIRIDTSNYNGLAIKINIPVAITKISPMHNYNSITVGRSINGCLNCGIL